MERCAKLIAALLVLTYVLIPSKQILAYNNSLQNDNTESTNQQNKEVISITNEELLLLSKLVAGEARGESYEGQVAVAAVVINRVRDSRFPGTIEGVIYQKNAFSVVADGSINMNPTESAYKAAQQALYGLDPTNKAVYFWNPDIATCKWIKTLDPYMRIGNHVFAK
ncbi:cell wall hydrolase [Romboutsia weinsteinii]|uniref:Cell wall hydrolase n=1 Tax=Romboutsia weinsteinii TaxID=2020949 RepID=A0A371J0D6_9FIRM|nr:cell wall hydrolase [Romboutsia weinsteinii]RDY26185.1 cell wall hydrolase [Romboutsia weinsteinii]